MEIVDPPPALGVLDGTTVLLAGTDINDVVVTVVGGSLSTDVLDVNVLDGNVLEGVVATDVSLVELSTSEELSGTEVED